MALQPPENLIGLHSLTADEKERRKTTGLYRLRSGGDFNSSAYHVAVLARLAEAVALGQLAYPTYITKKGYKGSFGDFIGEILVPVIDTDVFLLAKQLIDNGGSELRRFFNEGEFFQGLFKLDKPTVWAAEARDELRKNYSRLMHIDLETMAKIAVFYHSNVKFPQTFKVGTRGIMEYIPSQLTGIPTVTVSSRSYQIDVEKRDSEHQTFIPVLLRNVIPYSPTAISSILFRLRYNRFLSQWKATDPEQYDKYVPTTRRLFTPAMVVLVIIKPDHESDADLISMAIYIPSHDTQDLANDFYLIDAQGTLSENGDYYIARMVDPTDVDAHLKRVISAKQISTLGGARVHFAAYVYDTYLKGVAFPKFGNLAHGLRTMNRNARSSLNLQNKLEFYSFPEYDALHPSQSVDPNAGLSSANKLTLLDLESL